MDGVVAQAIRYLGEVELIIPYHLLGRVDLHHREEINHSAALGVPEYLLELGAAHQIIPADAVNGHVLVNMLFHIPYNAVVGIAASSVLRHGVQEGAYMQGVGEISSVEMDHEFLQIMAD